MYYKLIFLDIFKIIPILPIETKREEPPYEINGKVTPVTGIKPTTTHKFKIVWKIIPNIRPNAKYLPNKSLEKKLILNAR